jgi:hypothetical protein
MNTLRSSRLPEEPTAEKARRTRPLAVSIVVHVLLAALFVRFLVSPAAFTMIFGRAHSPEIPAERIGFLQLPKSSGPAVQGKSGGDNRPVSKTAPKKLVAPTSIPTAIPSVPVVTAPQEPEGGSGPLVGTGGPARGIRPTYTDPRVWAAPGDIVAAPKSAKEKLDSAVASIIAPYNDSVAAAAGGRRPGDWTFERGGRKYGIDEKYIRLGKISIPTAILALLPINTTGNPTMNDRNRLQNQLHADIFWNAQRGMNEADFKKAVRSIRERKEREKADAEKKARQADQPAAQSPPDKN